MPAIAAVTAVAAESIACAVAVHLLLHSLTLLLHWLWLYMCAAVLAFAVAPFSALLHQLVFCSMCLCYCYCACCCHHVCGRLFAAPVTTVVAFCAVIAACAAALLYG